MKAIQEFSAEPYDSEVETSTEFDRARAHERTNVSIVQGSRFGCLDDGFRRFNMILPPTVNVVGAVSEVAVDDDRFGNMVQKS